MDRSFVWRRWRGPCVAVLFCVLAAGSSASAQETRAEAVALEQSRKATALHPYEPGTAERVITWIEDKGFFVNPRGWYPTGGGLLQGAGLNLGLGFRTYTGDTSYFDVRGVYSIKGYKLGEVQHQWPGLAGGKLSLGVRGGWRDAPQLKFFGIGPDSLRELETNALIAETFAGVRARVRPARPLFIGVAVDYLAYDSGRGRAPSSRSIEELFTSFDTPGLGAEPEYVRGSVEAGIDWRDSPGYSRRGGLYRVAYNRYEERSDENLSFGRVDAEVVQFIPILRENWVIGLRGEVSMIDTDSGNQAPWWLLPSLGGGSTLRAYESFRFRDRNSLLLTAEWRWIVNAIWDMAVFYDAGKVAPDRSDLDFEDLKSNWGIGARFHGPAFSVLRTEVAKGSEGWRFVITGGQPF